MGLDVSHDIWHGPYSQFHRWRNWVAQQIGLPFELVAGIAPELPTLEQRKKLTWFGEHALLRDVGAFQDQNLLDKLVQGYTTQIDLNLMRGHPLYYIFAHGDCNGRLRWWHCKDIAIFLSQLLRETESDETENLERSYAYQLEDLKTYRPNPGWENLARFPPVPIRRGVYDGYWMATKRFALGCMKAYKAREDAVFC